MIQSKLLFHVLADEIQLRVIRLLAATHEEACLCELVDSLLVPADKLSRHLIILRQAGFLLSYKDRRRFYHRLVLKPSYLELLYEAVLALPDSEQIYKADLTRFKERMCWRDRGGRCQVGIMTDNLKATIN